jgi:hypothetical protein
VTGPDEAAPAQADAQSVVDWYRRHLADMTHRAAFAESSLALERRHAAGLRTELGQISLEVEALQAVAGAAPGFDDAAFGAWVVEHWAEIEDARIAHAAEHADRPAILEQP